MAYLQKFRSSHLNRWLQRFLRVFQFLSAIVSLALFSARLAKIRRLSQQASQSDGAVEGILVAATLYTAIVGLLACCLKQGGPKILRWVLILLDLLFLAAFIAVAVLTRPNGGPSGPCSDNDRLGRLAIELGANDCRLPWGTFILAIISTILHFLTALFHEVRDHHRTAKESHEHEEMAYGSSHRNGHSQSLR